MHYILYFTYCYKKEIGIHIFIISSLGKNQKEYLEKNQWFFNFIVYVSLHKKEPSFSHLFCPVHENQSE